MQARTLHHLSYIDFIVASSASEFGDTALNRDTYVLIQHANENHFFYFNRKKKIKINIEQVADLSLALNPFDLVKVKKCIESYHLNQELKQVAEQITFQLRSENRQKIIAIIEKVQIDYTNLDNSYLLIFVNYLYKTRRRSPEIDHAIGVLKNSFQCQTVDKQQLKESIKLLKESITDELKCESTQRKGTDQLIQTIVSWFNDPQGGWETTSFNTRLMLSLYELIPLNKKSNPDLIKENVKLLKDFLVTQIDEKRQAELKEIEDSFIKIEKEKDQSKKILNRNNQIILKQMEIIKRHDELSGQLEKEIEKNKEFISHLRGQLEINQKAVFNLAEKNAELESKYCLLLEEKSMTEALLALNKKTIHDQEEKEKRLDIMVVAWQRRLKKLSKNIQLLDIEKNDLLNKVDKLKEDNTAVSTLIQSRETKLAELMIADARQAAYLDMTNKKLAKKHHELKIKQDELNQLDNELGLKINIEKVVPPSLRREVSKYMHEAGQMYMYNELNGKSRADIYVPDREAQRENMLKNAMKVIESEIENRKIESGQRGALQLPVDRKSTFETLFTNQIQNVKKLKEEERKKQEKQAEERSQLNKAKPTKIPDVCWSKACYVAPVPTENESRQRKEVKVFLESFFTPKLNKPPVQSDETLSKEERPLPPLLSRRL